MCRWVRWVVWTNTPLVTHFGFLVYLSYFILWLALSLHQLTDFDNLYGVRRVSAQGNAFCCPFDTAAHFGGEIPLKSPFWEQ